MRITLSFSWILYIRGLCEAKPDERLSNISHTIHAYVNGVASFEENNWMVSRFRESEKMHIEGR